MQLQEGVEGVIAHTCQRLSNAEVNYSTTENEFVAVVRANVKFRPSTYGKPFMFVTDHRSLCWLAGLKDPSGCLSQGGVFGYKNTILACRDTNRDASRDASMVMPSAYIEKEPAKEDCCLVRSWCR